MTEVKEGATGKNKDLVVTVLNTARVPAFFDTPNSFPEASRTVIPFCISSIRVNVTFSPPALATARYGITIPSARNAGTLAISLLDTKTIVQATVTPIPYVFIKPHFHLARHDLCSYSLRCNFDLPIAKTSQPCTSGSWMISAKHRYLWRRLFGPKQTHPGRHESDSTVSSFPQGGIVTSPSWRLHFYFSSFCASESSSSVINTFWINFTID